jgi:hypothetical protein
MPPPGADAFSELPYQCPVTSTVTNVRSIQSGGVVQPEPDASAATRSTRAMVFIARFLRPPGALITDAASLEEKVIRRIREKTTALVVT